MRGSCHIPHRVTLFLLAFPSLHAPSQQQQLTYEHTLCPQHPCRFNPKPCTVAYPPLGLESPSNATLSPYLPAGLQAMNTHHQLPLYQVTLAKTQSPALMGMHMEPGSAVIVSCAPGSYTPAGSTHMAVLSCMEGGLWALNATLPDCHPGA